ncbi:MAG: DUF1501 domain-containing protein [Bacteroidota bacterium]
MGKHKYSRRQFLGTAPCLALGTTTLFSSLINLKAMNTMIGSTTLGGDYKALVCVLLNGGNDSFNMVLPRNTESYNEYATARSNQAIPQNEILPINPQTTDGREFGFHPAIVGLQGIFEAGDLAVVSNVGTLVEPVTKSTILDGTASLPLGLLSHLDQVMHWQTATPLDRNSASGWGGRMADILQEMNSNQEVSMNISLSGNNLFQRGGEVVEYAINNDGSVAILGWDGPHPFLQMMTEDVSDMMNKTYEDIFKDSYAGTLRRSVNSNDVFNAALEGTEDMVGFFTPGNPLAQDLRMVAQTIAGRSDLGAQRQIFFVQLGGFDNHDELLDNHELLMTTVDQALSEFYAATEMLGVKDNVTTFTISDFARTLSSNGNGTDHAWGGNALVMGGAVNGQEMYGEYPILSLGTDLELGGGVFLPTTAADEYFAEICLWFGISPNDLSMILPNIGNFYDVAGGGNPIGFMDI